MKIIRNGIQNALNFNAPIPESLRRKKLLNFMIWVIMGMAILVLIGHLLIILILGPSDDPGNDYLLLGIPIILLGLAVVLVINYRTQGYWASFIFIAVMFIASILDDPAEVA
ncbi:MAG: hypothetical protein R6W69_09575, partial [Anaerolineales bacterium]